MLASDDLVLQDDPIVTDDESSSTSSSTSTSTSTTSTTTTSASKEPTIDNREIELIPSDSEENGTYTVNRRRFLNACGVIREMFEHGNVDDGDVPQVHLIKVNHETLSRVIEFINQHPNDTDTPSGNEDIETIMRELVDNFETRYAPFFDPMTVEQIVALLMAANYLEYKFLIHTVAMRVGTVVKKSEPAEIYAYFKTTEPTPEEKEAARAEYTWIAAS